LIFSRVVSRPLTRTRKRHSRSCIEGEIAAVALAAGKPAPLFSELIGEDGLFLAIPQDLEAIDSCVAARLTAANFPGLVPYNQPVVRQSPGRFRPLLQCRQFCRGALYRLPVITRTWPSSQVARGQHHSGASRLAALSARGAVAAARRPGGRRTQLGGT
jgi:hypothetical protein